MAANSLGTGKGLEVTAPYILISGQPFLVGASLFGIALTAAASGATVSMDITPGIWEVPCLESAVIAVGDQLYWDDTAKEVNKTASGNVSVGVATGASADTIEQVDMFLTPTPLITA